MHRMLVQMQIILLAVSMLQLVIVSDNKFKLRENVLVVSNRVVLKININKDVRIQVWIDSLSLAQDNAAVIKTCIFIFKIS